MISPKQNGHRGRCRIRCLNPVRPDLRLLATVAKCRMDICAGVLCAADSYVDWGSYSVGKVDQQWFDAYLETHGRVTKAAIRRGCASK